MSSKKYSMRKNYNFSRNQISLDALGACAGACDGDACEFIGIRIALGGRFCRFTVHVREGDTMLRMISRIFCCIAAVLSLAGCSQAPASYANSYENTQARLPVRGSLGSYTLGPNDQVHVTVYNEATITGDYIVDGAGFVAIPVAGRVRAAGLTTEQLERRITSKLNGGILKDARVTVQVGNYAPFYIRGEVKKPGEFPYKPGLTLGDAVALAGGYTYRADESRAFVRSAGTGAEIARPLEVDPPIAPGDNIRIPERFF
jgi:polysaccharide export outer membrane protein